MQYKINIKIQLTEANINDILKLLNCFNIGIKLWVLNLKIKIFQSKQN